MTKADIIQGVVDRVRLTKKDATDAVELVLEALKQQFEDGGKVKISGFGHFYVREKQSRTGRSPATGEEILLPGRRVLSFRPSQVLKNALNKADAPSDPGEGSKLP